MERETAKQTLLDYGWDAGERLRIAEVLRFLEQDAECQQAVAEYDRIRVALQAPESLPAPDAGWDALATRLEHAAARPRRGRLWLATWTSAAAAAVLLAGLAGHAWRGAGAHRPVSNHQAAAASPAFATHEIRDDVSVFHQVADVFDQRASWVLLSDQTSDVGLGRDPTQCEDRLLLLRLLLSRGTQVVSSADLVIVPGEGADLTVPVENGLRLCYRITAGGQPQTHLSIWAELQNAAGTGRTLAALATDLPVEPGQTLRAGEMVTTTGNYVLKVAYTQASLNGRRS
jgi:hypothetical protein